MRTMIVASLVLGTLVAHAEGDFDPDFYVFFEKCQSTAAVRYQPAKNAQAIRMIEVEGYALACERARKRGLTCLVSFTDGSKPVMLDATIKDETFLGITFEGKNGGDFVDINPETRTAVSLTRMWNEKFVASKVCHGSYLTADEARLLKEREKRATKK
jgi:hypothetical protein